MGGTRAGGLAAAATNKKRYGEDWYAKIGAKGGSNGHVGGFSRDNPSLASTAGSIGGQRSRKGYKFLREAPDYRYYLDKATGKEVRMRRYDTWPTGQ